MNKKNNMVMSMQSFVKDINREIYTHDKELRTKAARYMQTKIIRKLRSAPAESVAGGVPAKQTGNLIKGVRTRNKRTFSEVGVRAPHAHLVEYGHDVIRNGVKIGEAAPRPFVKPTWDEERSNVINILSELRVKK